jgi:excisionase family DNA binding protein
MKKYLTVSEIASDLGISCQTIYKWSQSGQFIPMPKLGGTYRIESNAYLEWKESQLNHSQTKKIG